uniref:Sister chromatid cohesion protein n=1 Tax=Peronospora matthiolae TaxID=2874970 RepID=A0AAV1V1C0_9STRA
MRSAHYLFPLYLDPEDALAADARESLHPVTCDSTQVCHSYDSQRLAALIRTATTDGLGEHCGSADEATGIDADTLNSLPKWAQAVVQTGCFNGDEAHGVKRISETQQELDSGRSRKRRSTDSAKHESLIQNEADEVPSGVDEVHAGVKLDVDMDDEEKLATLFTQAEIAADNIDKYASVLESLAYNATCRQQHESFDRDGMILFEPEEVKMLLQSLRAMEKNEWIDKLEPQLLISLMNAFDVQVKMGLAVDVLRDAFPSIEKGKPLPEKIDDGLVSRLLASLDVGICELIVMTTPHIDRRVLSEDVIDNCFQLLYHTIRQLLLPCIDTTHVTTASAPIVKDNARRQSTGCKSSKSSRVNLQTRRDIRKTVDRVSHVVCEYMDQVAALILSLKLSDRWILSLSCSMIELFSLEHSSYATSLQHSALSILRSIFVRYKHHQKSLLGDVVEVMIKLPTAKRTLRTVKLLDSTNLVQQVSTLAVSMIQATASAFIPMVKNDNIYSRPDLVKSPSATDTASGDKGEQDHDAVEGTLAETMNNARSFVQKLLRACWKKVEERDNRVVLDNFVEDLLVMFVRPEWIGAEYLLEALSSSLASVLHASILKNTNKPDSHQTVAALNTVGKICASIRRYQIKASQSTMKEDSDSVAVIEEHANSLYASIAGAEMTSKHVLKDASYDLYYQMALKRITLMYLQRNSLIRGDATNLLTTKFIAETGGHWDTAGSMCAEREINLWKSFWDVSKGGIDAKIKVAIPTNELALKACLCLVVKRGFCGLFDRLLAHIMALLSKGIPSLRARVMKCLRAIVDVDPMLMAEAGVQLAVQKCCSDEKPSVREAAVELVGTYIWLQPLLFDKYFDVLAARARDKGIKVRKSVCKIFKLALSCDVRTGLELRRKSDCMRCLVERVGDAAEDQGVKNFIIDTFQEVWFGAELSSSRLTNHFNEFCDMTTLPPGWKPVAAQTNDKSDAGSLLDGSATFVSEDGIIVNSIEDAWSSYHTPMVTPASVVKGNDSKLDNSSEVVTTIVEVVHGMPNLTWFTKLLKRLLEAHNSISRKTAARGSQSRSAEIALAEDRSKRIISRLVDCLMDIQEGTLLSGVSIQDGYHQFLSCMTALAAFCEVKPQLLVPHLETIRVYLKEEDAKIQKLSVSMIDNILSVKRVPQSIAERLEDDLKALVLRSPPSVVGPSIKCLATLSKRRYTARVLLLRLLERFYLNMRNYGQQTTLSNLLERDHVLQRALYAAGKIVGAMNIDECLDLSKETKVLEVGTITVSLYELYSQFVRMPGNESCAAKAVQGMGFLFSIRPRLFLRAQQDELLDFMLKSNLLKVKLQCLVSMKELLLYEERRLENGQAAQMMNQSKSKEQQVQGDQEADASLIGNIMQAELENILRLSMQHAPQLRIQAVACVGALLTQGLVNPLQCIPNLVALETDRVPDVRDAAFAQLTTLYEKFQSQIHTPLIKGIRESYAFQLSVYGNCSALGSVANEKDFCLFGRLYMNFLKSTKSRESLFLKALVDQFHDQGTVLKPLNNDMAAGSSKEASVSALKYLCYLAQIISTLPYDVEDEPLYVIYLINRYVSLRLGHVLEDLKGAFAKAGMAPEQLEDEDSDLSMINVAEFRPLCPLGTSALSALEKNGRIAFAIALLLRLKFALKNNYQLDDERCATFKPSISEVLVEARERSPKKLLLPSVDDLCRNDDAIESSWNLFMIAWRAACKDQKQLDMDMEDNLKKPKTPSTRRRRSHKVVASKLHQGSESDGDTADGYIEGFA